MRLRVIGGFSLLAGARAVDLRNRKAQAILAYLALSNPAQQSRERLADALWSDSAADQARQSLRQTLHDLKRALGTTDGFIDIRRADVALNREAVDVDVLALIERLESGAPPPDAVDWNSLADAILPGFDDVAPVFGEWLQTRRRSLLDRLISALDAGMNAAVGEGGRTWALALAALDPAHEPACRRLMTLDAARGDVRAALRRYAALWDLLDEDYAAEPSPETQALYVHLKSLEAPHGPIATPAQAARPSLTLCMGGFRLDGVSEQFGYLVRGFRQDLIASLTPYREWVLIEPGAGAEPPQADGVYEIEAVAFPSRDGVRINLTLKETAARRFVWGQQDIGLTLDRWFETCRNTTRRIAAALDVRISGDRLARQGAGEDVSAPLYDKLLRARDLLSRWTPEDDRRAEAIFRDILNADPDFSAAQIGIVKIVNSQHIVFPGVRRPRPGENDSVRLAQAAVDADPLDAEALLCLGWSLALAARRDEAIEALNQCVEINPNDPRKLASAADALANCGALDRARAMAAASLELDLGAARMNWGYRASTAWICGDDEACVAAATKADHATPLTGGFHAAALARMGRLGDAAAVWRVYADRLRPLWRGRADFSDAALADWLTDAPPMLDPAVRERFATAVRAAAC
ncbi:MAG: BTAD domain-containing putative transcriptional regulator [Rubrimonas sp.]